ncbi:MAG TPA: DUF4175 family protein [Planctomycetota bacterium]|nr:DUF4175 family protein [Planctomycetota bacterium]
MASLAELQTRIAAVRNKERTVVILSGLFRTVVTLVVTVLAYFLIDWLFDLPYPARLLFAGTGLSVIGYVVWKYLLLELARIQDDDEIALRVESRNADLRGRLISTLQLSREDKAGKYVGSPELLSALEDETVRMSEPLDFFKIINTETVMKFGMAAAMILVIKMALVFRFPDYFQALGVRLISPNASFPTKTRVKEIKQPQHIVRGEDVPIEVIVDETSEIPHQPGTLFFQAVNKETVVPIELAPIGGTTFKGTLTKALEDMKVVVWIGDYKSEPFLLRVLPRPEVDVTASGHCISYKLPEYTREKDPPAEKFGGMTALVGSTASVKFVATKPLASATIERSDGRNFPLQKRVEKRIEGEGEKKVEKTLEWWELSSFPIDKSGSFHVALVDTDGLKNSQPPVEYPIDARPDNPPAIRLIKPSKDLTITPMAKLNVSFSARDDWGLRTLWIVYRIQTEAQLANENAPVELKRIERPFPKEKDALPKVVPPTPFVWDVSALNLKVGDQVVFWLEADDECAGNDNMPQGRTRRAGDAPPDPNAKYYPRSGDVKLTVISREDKALELQAEVERLYQLIVQQKENQEELKAKVRILLEEIQKLKQQ